MRRFDCRHLIFIAITLGLIALGVFCFKYSFLRLAESCRDFGVSIAYYFCTFLGLDFSPFVGVVNLSTVTPSVWYYFPITFEEFKLRFVSFWQTFVSADNFYGYFLELGKIFLVCFTLFLFLVVLVVLVKIAVSSHARTQNNRHGKETFALRLHKRISGVTIRPVVIWLKSLFTFGNNHRFYIVIWGVLALLYLNVFSIILEALAFLFYFVMSYDFKNIYIQLYKLAIDVAPFVYIPLGVWILAFFVLLYVMGIRRGYDNLEHNERKNRGLLNSLGIVNNIYGYVGAGKTALMTDIALSYEAQFLSDALEIILETDFCFPYVNWINVESELRRAAYFHVVCDKWSIRRWILKKKARFEKAPSPERIFGYDYTTYPMTYDTKLVNKNIWETIEEYCCAYFIYTVQSSYLISNYSIRVDKLVDSVGNFPLWNTDFFRRDSRLIDSFSRHSHILDNDMLRLGKTMLENNPNRNAFGFGIYVNTEFDKERKNMLELKGVERDDEECNQKNDLYNPLVKTSRHACVVANRVFTRWLGDLQRLGSLGADSVQLGDVIEVRDKSERVPVIPGYSPFWVIDGLLYPLVSRFESYYLQYRYSRGDTSLFIYLLKGVVTKFFSYHLRMYNLFGCEIISLSLQSGFLDGKTTDLKWYRQSKKIWSDRYATDCLSSIFEARSVDNKVGLDDLPEYAGKHPTDDEFGRQHSFFQRDVHKYASTSDPRTAAPAVRRFLYLSEGNIETVIYETPADLQAKLWSLYSSGEIKETVLRQTLARSVKIPEDVGPIEDLSNWLIDLYVKGKIQENAFVAYYDKINKYVALGNIKGNKKSSVAKSH